MELTRKLTRGAMARPGVLLAVSPGATRERLAIEAELARRGWRCVAVPAEADLLVIVGDREAEESDWVANLWRAVPSPKAWVRLTDIEQISETFDHGLTELRRGDPVRPPGHSRHADQAATRTRPDTKTTVVGTRRRDRMRSRKVTTSTLETLNMSNPPRTTRSSPTRTTRTGTRGRPKAAPGTKILTMSVADTRRTTVTVDMRRAAGTTWAAAITVTPGTTWAASWTDCPWPIGPMTGTG
ncbi:hypothetical protein GCM10018777_11530 [Streptomyces albogriseolus]|uniref:hypothetical protein n=1 Tax=Streptomyces albogriseolus TaxID=1887 RepID=UPI0016779575|nr:hypothetical protein [Streptomyces viridodiastaticus]GHG02379.1 hypothetical protein GCM10018777_11530 [Streptomyces viridodiastaticus]